ncbi:hypothetical protein K466DRAFT_666809 [Polyporus arcularius HHB13444]|uniref:F-box domain-containing protein n=1 Tax=Polyporus arcularius HHB13444 TaxID=1314778 RepID=A0A5C3NYW1_9APHY|nr:hypothetical protein K466DRAFT_666809 [Polyporus arcularius HHB13444]
MNLDVLRLVCQELKRMDGTITLHKLASCSRILQQVAAPYIFYCYGALRGSTPPPQEICRHIRHIKIWETIEPGDTIWLGDLLDGLPSLNAITLEGRSGVAWSVLDEIIFARPSIASFTINSCVDFTEDASEELPNSSSSSITSLSYAPEMWRELENEIPRRGGGPQDLDAVFSHEAKCLDALVSRVHGTLVQLTLPMETAPLLSMIALGLPKVQELSLFGRYLTDEQVESLPLLLSSLMELRKLSIQVMRSEPLDRPFILGHHSAPPTSLSGLRSLTVAYPHPDDDLFSIDTSHLNHLSLRDSPRYYAHLSDAGESWHGDWATPLLSAVECLSILKRMGSPPLTSLELAYLVPRASSDDDLLEYVVNSFPALATLEIHRYRQNRDERVDHKGIVGHLAGAKSLRWLRLNLDFREDHGAYCAELTFRDVWFSRLTGSIGWEIVDALEVHCPLLESVEILYHAIPTSIWLEFHPCRCADPRFVLDFEREDIEAIPQRWYPRRCSPLPDVTPPPRCDRSTVDGP